MTASDVLIISLISTLVGTIVGIVYVKLFHDEEEKSFFVEDTKNNTYW